MWSKRETLQFSVKLGLRKGLSRIRGMRRSLTDEQQDRVADAIVEHLELSNWKIEVTGAWHQHAVMTQSYRRGDRPCENCSASSQ
jgi:hypothetical protein